MLFYATPILYAADAIPGKFRWILNLNPMAMIINGYRDIFYNQVVPDVSALMILIGISLVLCAIGYIIFNKLQNLL